MSVSLTSPALAKPRLRPGIAAARDESDPRAIVLYDQFRLSRKIVRLGAREFSWLQWLDGETSLREIQAQAMRRDGGLLHPIEPLATLVSILDEAMFLDGPRFRAALDSPIREPACIGCYKAERDALRRQIDGYFTMPGGPGMPGPRRRGEPPLKALLAPHIDYARGNVTYAWAYRELAERTNANLFVIIGTSHYSGERFTLSRQDFKTPLGTVPTDRDYVSRIASSYGDGLFDDPLAHIPEHSIELEVVFLQYLFPDRPLRIVPLLVGSFQDCVEQNRDPADAPDICRMVEALRHAESAGNEPVCYIISGDLAHIGPKFGDDEPAAEPFLTHSRKQDEKIIAAAETVDPAAYFRTIADEGDVRRICGLPPTWLTLAVTQPKSGNLLHYGRSVHPEGYESVSFAGMAFSE